MSEGTSQKEDEDSIKSAEESLRNGRASQSSGKQSFLIAIAMLGCCGLPLLLVAASSLALVSFFTITNTVVLISVIVALSLSVYAIRRKSRRSGKQSASCCD